MKYYKYQSLGNEFILLDDDASIDSAWIKQNCDRKQGVGADGVLVVKNNPPEVLMFNADGTDGQRCFNGVRCAVLHLHTQKNFPQKFSIKMQTPIYCEIHDNLITLNFGKAYYKKPHEIKIKDKILQGHIVDVGNPHFVVLEKVDLNWLQKYGKEIENHKDFPNRTNVEFVWGNYNALIYERGCGITKACGTGAAAIIQTLYHESKIALNQEISIHMPGGILKSYLDNDESIVQIAPAEMIC